jgi:hypothetical protein
VIILIEKPPGKCARKESSQALKAAVIQADPFDPEFNHKILSLPAVSLSKPSNG